MPGILTGLLIDSARHINGARLSFREPNQRLSSMLASGLSMR
uniref:Uncharacterized protein n=1 Tax=Candidatus Kentrum eta TaxID=2126337 RepID=A0A450VLL1_9GAMM|nr:MAG: hypothetical protein BECKH772B_GA0070898_102963 [Candidatus Kentron sp. H]VFK02935.1 MAG: hypothetical protein BECKH772A_GA0070896_102963 [Candidatus Kentron sp. H]VFK05675.1 MAG: hypothetical protein BECKH772C_GA0070978_102923 [Candidatus Kentron sp. H]